MWHEAELIDVYLAVYDTLVDDDEDVRDQGASTVSSLLPMAEASPQSEDNDPPCLSLSPPAAKRRLLGFLQESYCDSRCIHLRAVERLTGLQIPSKETSTTNDGITIGRIELRPVASILANARLPQLAVFVAEKQNLCIDTAAEAEIWTELLCKLNDKAIDNEMIAALESWTLKGLRHFLEIFRKERAGPLGLMSQPEVYTLFMRVILAAKVLMASTAGESAQDCRGLLEEMLKIGKKVRLHDLLIDNSEIILGSSALDESLGK